MTNEATLTRRIMRYLPMGAAVAVHCALAQPDQVRALVLCSAGARFTLSDADLERGCIFPPLERIRDVSVRIATAVAEVAYRCDLAREPLPDDLPTHVRSQMYEPDYPDYA